MKTRSTHLAALAGGLVVGLLLVVTVSALGLGRVTRPDDALLQRADDLIAKPSRGVSVFYPTNDTIVEERVAVDSDANAPLSAMRELFKAKPRNKEIRVTLPPAKVRSVSVRNRLATVDFSRGVLVTGATKTVQRVALVSIIYTLRQFPNVKKVAFTVEGRTRGRIGGKDVATFWGDVTLHEMPWSVASRSLTGKTKKGD